MDHSFKGDSPVYMGLGIEENFRMAHILAADLLKICPHQVVEILFRLQNPGALVVDIQKILELGEVIGFPDLIHGIIGQFDLIPPC